MVNSTDYTKETINSGNYGRSLDTSDVLLLENGDELLLEDGIDSILLEILEVSSADYTKGTINSTDYT